MAAASIKDLKPTDTNKSIEVKVYRKWVSRNPPKSIPTGYCCMLLDKQGHAIQANMDFNDMQYFDQVLEHNSAYKISDFSYEETKTWQQTLSNRTTLKFGRSTNFQNIPNVGFPDHYFEFVSYNQLYSRLKKNSILTDYIGCIQRVGDVLKTGDPNRYQIIRRKIDIENLNGNVIELTLWDEMATEFDEHAFELMEKPVIIAVTSCRVSKYIDLQLSATPATHYYLNPNIPEVEQSRATYQQRYHINPPLQIQKQKYYDAEREKGRNKFPLALLLAQNPDNYKSVRFTCEGTIVDISTARRWFYRTCTLCNNKLTDDTPTPECPTHGAQAKANYRYSFRASVTDQSTTAAFTFFSPNADTIVQSDCNNLVKTLENPDPYQLPPAIGAIKGKNHTFQFHFNPLSRKESPEFIFDAILDNITSDVTPPDTPHIKSIATQESESKTSTKRKLIFPESAVTTETSSKKPKTNGDSPTEKI